MLLHLYSSGQQTDSQGKKPGNTYSDRQRPMPNGHARGHSDAERQARDVQEFELEGLMSEDEDEGDERKVNGRL